MEGSVDNVNLAAAKCLCFLILCAIMVSWYDNLVRYILSIKTRRQSVSLGRGVERQWMLLRCWWVFWYCHVLTYNYVPMEEV